ncbi:hypothetical protein, partial [Tenacibaculum maritimum]|uniref:hypothetical protein n=1 Tax=Tenacibaculum maritimum TaxID=107401 RepID=UPI001F34C5FF
FAFLPDFKSSTNITLKSLSYFVAIIQIYYLWTQLIRLNKCRHSRVKKFVQEIGVKVCTSFLKWVKKFVQEIGVKV